MAISRLRVCAALFALTFLLVGCATARSDARIRAPAQELGWQPALAGVYARMVASMSRPGEIYQPTISIIETQGEFTFSTRVRASIDVANSSARGEMEAVFSPENVKRTTWIINGRRYHQTLEYDPTFVREATTCRGAKDPLASILIVCRGGNEQGVTTTLMDADYHGQPAIAMVTLGGVSSPTSRSSFTDTLFLDPETYMPIAQEGSGRIESLDADGNVTGSGETGRLVLYEHEFKPADSYAAYHFDPASIGFVEDDPVAAIKKPRPDVTLYWIGADASIEDAPPVALRGALVAEGYSRPAERYRAIVSYRPVANEFGPTLIELKQWRLDDWRIAEADGLRAWPPDVCVLKEDLEVEGMAVVLFHAYSDGRRNLASGVCPTAPPDRYVALVTTAASVIRVAAPEPGEFNTREAMLDVVATLSPVN